MASHPKDRKRFTTEPALLKLATTVRLIPQVDRAVFYAEDDGARAAADFVSPGRGFTRLDELLQKTPEGQSL